MEWILHHALISFKETHVCFVGAFVDACFDMSASAEIQRACYVFRCFACVTDVEQSQMFHGIHLICEDLFRLNDMLLLQKLNSNSLIELASLVK